MSDHVTVGEKKSVRLITPLDGVAPIGVTTVAVALGVLGSMRAETLPAQIISLATAGAFIVYLVAWFVLRYRLVRADFSTLHGLHVVLGRRKNRPQRALVEAWVNDLMDVWTRKAFNFEGQRIQLKSHHVLGAIRGCRVFFLDREKLTAVGRYVRGYAHGSMFAVGYRPGVDAIAYVESLFKHECSHCILGWCGFSWNEDKHHEIFKEMGF